MLRFQIHARASFQKVRNTFFFLCNIGKTAEEGEKEATIHELELLCKEGSYQSRDDAVCVAAVLTAVITADHPKACSHLHTLSPPTVGLVLS
jgi:hypothetical protein